MSELTAAEAAVRLGVKPATVYAYVSRGILHRHLAADGRTSRYDAQEVDALRSRRRRAFEGELETVVSTALTSVADGDLRIRGRSLTAMVEAGLGYEEVVDWIWDTSGEQWRLPDKVAAAVGAAQESLPRTTGLIDRLRVTTAVVSATDPMRLDRSPFGVCRASRILLLAMAAGLPPRSPAATGEGIAESLWSRLTRKRATAGRRATLNAALALLVDHSLASSTLAARIAASVRADPYSIVGAGLGVVGGPMHGAASGRVHRLFADAARRRDAATAVAETQQQSTSPPGFGHKVYRREDPRFTTLMRLVDEAWLDHSRLATVHAVQEVIGERTDTLANIDFAIGALTWLADMTPDAGTAIFAIARSAGWIAHGLEEYEEPAVRFRPRARYTGPRQV